jgi:hypothetical protein
MLTGSSLTPWCKALHRRTRCRPSGRCTRDRAVPASRAHRGLPFKAAAVYVHAPRMQQGAEVWRRLHSADELVVMERQLTSGAMYLQQADM